MKRALGMSMLIGACLLLCAPPASAMTGPTLDRVDWHNIGDVVRFHLHWTNPTPGALTVPVDGSMKSQEFGVFLPDFGPIGLFHVPPIAPNSFFDVFFDVPLADLPPEPLEHQSGNGPGLRTAANQSVSCVPDTIWDGNVDVVWTGPGVAGQVLRHYGDLIVCPGGGPSYIHVRSTTCAVAAPWSVTGLCPGFTATLVNEDLSPAPNPIPPGWTGFISMTAAPGIAVGTTCCPILHFDCAGAPAEIELCATACDCNPNGPTLGSVDWQTIGTMVRFHLHWTNPAPAGAPATVPVSGSMKSQEFGVFLPDFGPIGQFNVPPIMPNSFFDVFFDVPLDLLPPEPLEQRSGNGPGLRMAANQGVPCVPDTIWDGNVDIIWTGPGVTGQVLRHYGDLIVCPGGGPSYIHVRSTTCTVAAPWSVTGLCAGFSVTLVNEDLSPAPNPIPPGWTGFISMTAAPGVAVGTTCCPILHFDCAGVPAEIELCATACDCNPNGPTLGSVDWQTIGTMVRFHLHWTNPDQTALTVPVNGSMKSQEFGVFLPDFGPIGQFNVPPIMPNSFFDVFFDVPLAQLPPEPLEQGPGNWPAGVAPCVPDTIWDGNVDIIWSGAGVSGQVLRHYGDLIVCPGGGPSYIHVRSTTCAVPAPWFVTGLCAGFSATLVNENLTPAPNPIPPGWTGFISMTAAATVPVGTTCCPILHFDCAGVPAEIELCATACDCHTVSVPSGADDFNFGIRSTVPNPTSGSITIGFAIPRASAARLSVYDASGQLVRTLVDGTLSAGPHAITWDGQTQTGRKLPAGAYFLKLSATGRSTNRKVIVLR